METGNLPCSQSQVHKHHQVIFVQLGHNCESYNSMLACLIDSINT